MAALLAVLFCGWGGVNAQPSPATPDGASYQWHWSFLPLTEEPPPQAANGAVRNAIDSFVLHRLEKEGLTPSPEAAQATLIRRVTLDLTGLPPSIDEVDAFLSDSSSSAYEKVVDRLLDSPAYGERMANLWLDVARYADTFGYQNDRENHVWPWRDWVIRAFNENLPYDAFVRWQLAGDLLPAPTQDQRLATAFNRLHRQTNEGGSIIEEWRVEYVADRTNTFATAFLGLTMECARCHDHKFDPISQKEYYQLFAFFNNIDESGMYSHFTNATPSPSMNLYDMMSELSHRVLQGAVTGAEEEAVLVVEPARERFRRWLADPGRSVPGLPVPLIDLPFELVTGDTTPDLADPNRDAKLEYDPTPVPGREGSALRFSGGNAVVLPRVAEFERTDAFSIALWLKTPKTLDTAVLCHRSEAALDAASRGYEVLLDEGRPVFGLNHFWPGNAIRIEADRPLPRGRWVHLVAVYDGSSRAGGMGLYLDGRVLATHVVRDRLTRTIRYGDSGSNPPLRLGARFRDLGFKGGALDGFKVFQTALTPLEVEAIQSGTALAPAIENRIGARDDDSVGPSALFAYYLHRVDKPYGEAMERLRTAREKENAFTGKVRSMMVMEEMKLPRQAYLLERGEYNRQKEPVSPGTPGALFPFAESLPRNRLGLAAWLLDGRNPLASRVAVNRFWQALFGRGLVETQEDFGSQGAAPSHPALLDFLARRFVDSGWDVKALNRLIVLSATYRQSSSPRPGPSARDPYNELLWRGPRRRMSAEQIRDSALAASGLLVRRVGGPSVRPYQPKGLWKDASQVTYRQGTGADLYRRSLYTFWKRTVPPPSMMTFDAAGREVCQVRRGQTTTPLQALVLLNDVQFVEAARVLAERALSRRDRSVAGRIEFMFRSLLTRRPNAVELEILRRAYAEQEQHFSAHGSDAKRYAATGETPRNEALDAEEVAATVALAQALMNFDEFQVKR